MDLFQHWLDFHNVRRALIVKPYAQDDGYCLVASKALTPVLHTRIVLPLLQTFPTLLNPSSATPAALLWAYTAIESRAFKLNLIGADPLVLNTTLVPLADLANHVPSARDATLRIERFDPHTRMLRIVCAETAPAAGRELHLCYNDLANWQLLLYYGFTILQNPFDRVNLSFGPPDDDDGEVKKLMLLALGEELGFGLEHSVQASWVEGADQVVGAGLVGSLRLLLMDEEDLSRYSVENLETLLRESASERNEQAVLETLRGLFEGMREQYPTTLGEDQERVEAVVGEGLSRGEYYTLLYLVGQKEIIDNALEWVEAREECQVSGNTLDGGSQSPSVPR
ncbi:hypothetical protein BC936DRAFT_145569 [Jimgerdemannia flammicorona]|uniref:Rubisco LSMT substrate-binding domain-containing protein n=1 Tax=Jimgerdemannia flammicorona TaxID=994334 RepID=A0A433D9S5_9FUNG|nr:hypothetical protein BC936DRAFT_145569 [Jimgerdemannia flammicorona]